MPVILVDKARAWEVFGVLLNALRNKLPPYNKIVHIRGRNIIPPDMKWQSREHGLFLFNACLYMRGMIDSTTAFGALVRLHQNHVWMFDPQEFGGSQRQRMRRQSDVRRFLRANGLGFDSHKASESWVANHFKLAKYWNGDAVSLYNDVKTYEDACQVLIRKGRFDKLNPNGFQGFQHKMVSMYTYFLMDAEFIRPMLFPVPVDFHILRVLVATGILAKPQIRAGSIMQVEGLRPAARALTFEYCEKEGVDPTELADALWHLSRRFCKEAPYNRSHVDRYRARRTRIFDLSPTLWTLEEGRAYNRSCGRCPIYEQCKWAIPSANYYRRGVIKIRANRLSNKPKQLDLFV